MMTAANIWSAVHRLTADGVNRHVPPEQLGVYKLGYLQRGTFPVYYVGRSDFDLPKRLMDHVREGRYKRFAFTCVQPAEDGYDLECALWHRYYGDLDNHIHPAIPHGYRKTCLVCGE